MKPNEAEIQWCLANRELVMRWLEQQGGWQVGDWCWNGREIGILMGIPTEYKTLVSVFRCPDWDEGRWSPETFGREQLIWLAGVGDVLEILGARDLSIWRDGESWRATDANTDADEAGETRLIALMELLKASES